MLDNETNTPTPILTTAPAPTATPVQPSTPTQTPTPAPTLTPTQTPASAADIVVLPDAPAPKPTAPAAAAASSDDTVADDEPAGQSETPKERVVPASEVQPTDDTELMSDIAGRIADAHNILIALSSDPSVDEMSAAIGLALVLDRAGKRATAIYSGQTPNVLGFLKPENTFETTADTLQDFVIAISKDKADHLRYKLDGDFVKIYITPYKTRVAEEDLEFSYGDFNIDLVIALNVTSNADLDSALREHGRIMHDATVINITTGNPGKLGKIEWSNKSASSVCELVARLLLSMDFALEKEDVTALLTGIIAATAHFSNTQTTPNAMQVASELLKLGANQQLISENLANESANASRPAKSNPATKDTKDTKDTEATKATSTEPAEAQGNDATALNIVHDDEDDKTEPSPEPAPAEPIVNTPAAMPEPIIPEPAIAEPIIKPAAVEPITPEPVTPAAPSSEIMSAEPPVDFLADNSPEKVVPSDSNASANNNPLEAEARKYSQMLEDALAEGAPVGPAGPVVSPQEEPAAPIIPNLTPATPSLAPAEPILSAEPTATPIVTPSLAEPTPAPIASPTTINPAANLAPAVPTNPEINGVPEMNFNMPGDILPPPPAPSIDAAFPPMPNDVLAELAKVPADELGVPTPPASVAVDAAAPAAANAPVSSPAFQIPSA